jgi:hypothetical protein
MKTYRITFFAPYAFAKFSCEAETIEDARAQRLERDREHGFEIPNREVKTEIWDGKKV